MALSLREVIFLENFMALSLREKFKCQSDSIDFGFITLYLYWRLIILSLLDIALYVASKPVCGLTLYKLRSSVLTGSLKLPVLCEILRVGIIISGLLIVNHVFRFR